MTRRRRRSDRSGRAPLFSPGRPPVAGREVHRQFWAAIATGMASVDAAVHAGMSQPVGARLFREAGGHATGDVSAISEAAVRPVSLVCGAGGDRPSSSARLLHAGGCAAGSDGQLQRSPGSCGAMLPPGAADWSIARQRRNGMPSDLLAARSRRSLRSTRHCEPMCRNDWQVSSSLRVGLLFPVRLCAGKAAGMDRGSIGGGQTPGARSRSPAVCRLTSRTMRPCASAMKPSIKHCLFKAVARCAAS